jgi:hypothetical protein
MEDYMESQGERFLANEFERICKNLTKLTETLSCLKIPNEVKLSAFQTIKSDYTLIFELKEGRMVLEYSVIAGLCELYFIAPNSKYVRVSVDDKQFPQLLQQYLEELCK